MTREERLAVVRDGIARGLSAGGLQLELAGASRSALLGAAFRAGLSFPHKGGGRRKGERAKAAAGAAQAGAAPSPPCRPAGRIAGGGAGERAAAARRLTLYQLTERTCKWPIGDPGEADFHFCGADSLEGLPYCRYHARVAYQAPEPRRLARRGGA